MTRARPETPTHCPSGERKRPSTTSRVAWGRSASMPSAASAPSAPASCAKKTSAGEASPSSRSVAASSEVLAYWTCTSSPLSDSKRSSSGPTSDSLRPEYTVRAPLGDSAAGDAQPERRTGALMDGSPVSGVSEAGAGLPLAPLEPHAAASRATSRTEPKGRRDDRKLGTSLVDAANGAIVSEVTGIGQPTLLDAVRCP